MDIFSIFFNMKVCCVFSLESPHRLIIIILIIVSVAYMPPLSNALKLFKCDTDQRFSMTYHQN